jgi:hypothetical protein
LLFCPVSALLSRKRGFRGSKGLRRTYGWLRLVGLRRKEKNTSGLGRVFGIDAWVKLPRAADLVRPVTPAFVLRYSQTLFQKKERTMADIHIPDVARMLGKAEQDRSQLDNIIKEFRKFIRAENLAEPEARQIWHDNFDTQFKAKIQQTSLLFDEVDRLIEEINASSAKRGRKFRHFQLMLEQTVRCIRSSFRNTVYRGRMLLTFPMWMSEVTRREKMCLRTAPSPGQWLDSEPTDVPLLFSWKSRR